MYIDIDKDQLEMISICFKAQIEKLNLQKRGKLEDAKKAGSIAAREFFERQAENLERLKQHYEETLKNIILKRSENGYNYIWNGLKVIEDSLKNDPAGYASTMLQRTRRHLEYLAEYKYNLFCWDCLTLDENDILSDRIRELKKKVYDLLNDRIKWQAQGIERTIEARKNAGTYKGEFTTAVILANAYNDIFKNDYDYNFDGGADN